MDTTETVSLGLPVANDYVPSYNELDNLVYITCKSTINWNMRSADLAVCLMMTGGPSNICGDAGISRLVYNTCEYLWDHITGGDSDLSPRTMFEHIQPFLFEWYESTTPEERAMI